MRLRHRLCFSCCYSHVHRLFVHNLFDFYNTIHYNRFFLLCVGKVRMDTSVASIALGDEIKPYKIHVCFALRLSIGEVG